MRNALLGLSLLSGCVLPIHSVHIGPLRPATSPCAITFARLTAAEAATYDQVGAICAGIHDEVIDKKESAKPYLDSLADAQARKAVEVRACALGGQIVSPVGICSVSRMNGTEFGVFVTRPATAGLGTGG